MRRHAVCSAMSHPFDSGSATSRLLAYSLLCLIMSTAPLASAADSRAKREQACRAIKADIERLQSQLRAGYTAKQGRRWRTKMRELELKRFRRCR